MLSIVAKTKIAQLMKMRGQNSGQTDERNDEIDVSIDAQKKEAVGAVLKIKSLQEWRSNHITKKSTDSNVSEHLYNDEGAVTTEDFVKRKNLMNCESVVIFVNVLTFLG